jgi:hypothetical protein
MDILLRFAEVQGLTICETVFLDSVHLSDTSINLQHCNALSKTYGLYLQGILCSYAETG